jgi:hypothetical protein
VGIQGINLFFLNYECENKDAYGFKPVQLIKLRVRLRELRMLRESRVCEGVKSLTFSSGYLKKKKKKKKKKSRLCCVVVCWVAFVTRIKKSGRG